MKIISSGGLARRLLGMGHIIGNLRPKRENPTESVFVFYRDRWLDEDITFCIENKTGESDILKKRLFDLKLTDSEYRSMIFSDYLEDK